MQKWINNSLDNNMFIKKIFVNLLKMLANQIKYITFFYYISIKSYDFIRNLNISLKFDDDKS